MKIRLSDDKELLWRTVDSSQIVSGAPTATQSDETGVTYRLDFIQDILKRNDDGLVVDIGSGYGAYISKVRNAVGVEPNPAYHKRHKPPVVAAIGEYLPFRSSSSQIVFALEVLEHVKDTKTVLAEVRRILKSNGYFFVTVPNRFYPFEMHGLQLCSFHKHNLLGIGIPLMSYFPNFVRKRIQRARIYSEKDITKLLMANGFAIVRVGYMPPPLERAGNGSLAKAIRKIIFKASKLPLLREMGISCMVLAKPKSEISHK